MVELKRAVSSYDHLFYYRSNCMSDCYIISAMRHCDCIPWDYPTLPKSNLTNSPRICDFYGKSCFNSYIENDLPERCKQNCVPGCNEIKYTFTAEREAIKSENICTYDPRDYENQLDLLDIETSIYLRNASDATSGIMRFKEALAGIKDSESFKIEHCIKRLMYDVAMVEVVMESPTVTKYIQREKDSITDKIGNFGKF